jgi:O-antigen/teichoic acid export membrane protein
VVAWWNASPEWMAAAYLLGPLVSAVLSWVAVSRHLCPVSLHWAPARFSRLLKDSRHFAAQQLLTLGSNHAESLISPRLLGMIPFGHFAAGATIGNRLAVLPDALCAVAYPTMVKACAESRPTAARVLSRYLLIALAAGVAVALAASLIALPLGRILLPDQAGLFATVVRITIWSVPLIGLELVMGYGINAAGREALQARLAVPAAVLSLTTSIALVLTMGIEGACWSTVARPAIRAAFLTPAAIKTFWTRDASAGLDNTWMPLRRAG